MSVQITVMPSGHQFSAEPGQTVLEAAIKAGIGLPYGCRNGACASCKGKVVAGEVDLGAYQSAALKADEIDRGMALFCCAVPRTDLTIEVREVVGAGDIPIKKLPCRVASLEKVTDDVAVLELQLPANERLQYHAGQYIEFLLKDGKRRSYSMASPPHRDGPLELHIRHMPGGVFTDAVFGVAGQPLKVRDILRFEGPLGSFFLREDSRKPIVFLASGTGFAPIQAILEHMAFRNIDREAVVYWGGRRPRDLYRDAWLRDYVQTHPNVRYVPVVSNAEPEDHWTGRTGFVHHAVMQDLPDLSGYQVYACGAPIMVNSAREDFLARCGLPADEFYADSFTSEADMAASG